MNVNYKEQLKSVISLSRAHNNDFRFGQYLYNILFLNIKDKENNGLKQSNYLIAEKLWTIEADELIKLIDDFEKHVEKST